MTAQTIDITRGAHSFAILDDPETRSWNFWEQQYASGVWEPETLSVIEDVLKDGGDYLDIGAWVGPTVLWAAQYADHVTALEPDPVAAGCLLANVGMNVNNVTIWPAAVTDGVEGSITMRSWRWGNSSSTIVPHDQIFPWIVAQPHIHQLDEVDVPAVDLADVIGVAGDDLRLVKIDIEGGEEALVPRLDEFHCPIILSLHLPWVADPDGMVEEIHRRPGHVTYLDASNHEFPVVLITPP